MKKHPVLARLALVAGSMLTPACATFITTPKAPMGVSTRVSVVEPGEVPAQAKKTLAGVDADANEGCSYWPEGTFVEGKIIVNVVKSKKNKKGADEGFDQVGQTTYYQDYRCEGHKAVKEGNMTDTKHHHTSRELKQREASQKPARGQ